MNGSLAVLFHATAADRLPTGKLETNGQRGGFQQQAMGKKRPTPKGSSWLICPCCPSAGLRQVGSFTRRSSHLDSPTLPSEACSPSFLVSLNGWDAHSPVEASPRAWGDQIRFTLLSTS